ncbi:hypothetical protein Rhal01_01170 [Rubritalea halochordaticola]|uniref:GIY-YIG domain-containing protein n=1 Tax=Rubritalea halochordaticola TaxID=714537 RepID=A0ABP9UX07_9BACT
MECFSPEIINKLGYYVYRLIDPRNGETFYVGKGKGNRVFAHIKGDIEEDSLNEKMSRIREIELADFRVAHVIHRHGMSESTALEVEGALIDAYPGLTNVMGGHGNSNYGAMHAKEIIQRYEAETVEFSHKVLMINVNRTATEGSLYEATRFAWRLNSNKASKADYIVAVQQGLIKGVFEADDWLEATQENFPGRETTEGRYGFVGREAPVEVVKEYKNKLVPEKFRKRGASNPIKYSW